MIQHKTHSCVAQIPGGCPQKWEHHEQRVVVFLWQCGTGGTQALCAVEACMRAAKPDAELQEFLQQSKTSAGGGSGRCLQFTDTLDVLSLE